MLNIKTATILEKEMDRKDFLKHVGIGLVAFSGVAVALKAMGYLSAPVSQSTNSTSNTSDSPRTVAASYGSMPYGGFKR